MILDDLWSMYKHDIKTYCYASAMISQCTYSVLADLLRKTLPIGGLQSSLPAPSGSLQRDKIEQQMKDTENAGGGLKLFIQM